MTTLTLQNIHNNTIFELEYPQDKLRSFLIRCYHGDKLRILAFICDTTEEYNECCYWYNRQETKNNKKEI